MNNKKAVAILDSNGLFYGVNLLYTQVTSKLLIVHLEVAWV
ncbi:hypothetical protein [Moritella sp.]|nr:hypothetical protein [Moritella sp.]